MSYLLFTAVITYACLLGCSAHDAVQASTGHDVSFLQTSLSMETDNASDIFRAVLDERQDAMPQTNQIVHIDLLQYRRAAVESLPVERVSFLEERIPRIPNISDDSRHWVHHHIWKTGGSNLCDIAIRNGEVVPHPTSKNPGGRCELWGDDEHFSYAQIQWPLGQPGLDQLIEQNVSLSVMMRDPYDHTVSHYKHVLATSNIESMTLREWVQMGICRQEEGTDSAPRCVLQYEDSMNRRGVPNATGKANAFKGHYFDYFQDNIQTRWLSGQIDGTVFSDKPGNLVDADAVVLAKQNLEMYTSVLILEQFDTRDIDRLAASLEWSDTEETKPQVGTIRHSDGEKELSVEDQEYLADLLQHDIALYTFAKDYAATQV